MSKGVSKGVFGEGEVDGGGGGNNRIFRPWIGFSGATTKGSLTLLIELLVIEKKGHQRPAVIQ